MKKINWKRLKWAIKEVSSETLVAVIFWGLCLLPGFIAILTNCAWWLILYPFLYFIAEIWEKYNDR